MSNIWVSLSTYGGVTTQEALEMFWEAGIRQVELAIGARPSPDTASVLRHYQQLGIRYRAHHAFVWKEQRSFNLAQKFDTQYFERLTDWLAAMDITDYSVHAGSYGSADDPATAYARFLQHVTHLGRMCRDRGIRLGVETMYPTEPDSTRHYLVKNANEVEHLLQDLPEIELVVDMAHLNIWRTATISEKLHMLQLAASYPVEGDTTNRLMEIHISDNDGRRDTHTTITEQTWWVPYVASFPSNILVVLESRMNRQSLEQVRKQIEAVRSLLFENGSE